MLYKELCHELDFRAARAPVEQSSSYKLPYNHVDPTASLTSVSRKDKHVVQKLDTTINIVIFSTECQCMFVTLFAVWKLFVHRLAGSLTAEIGQYLAEN